MKVKYIELGSKTTDFVTGIDGIAVGRLEYLNKCVCYEVQPHGSSEGTQIKPIWVDVQQLEVTAPPCEGLGEIEREVKHVELGSKVRDYITGIDGIAVGRLEYLNGCVCYQVQPHGAHNGTRIKSVWVDPQQLKILAPPRKEPVVVVETLWKPRGGPGAKPPERETPP